MSDEEKMNSTAKHPEVQWETLRADKWHAGLNQAPGAPEPIVVVVVCKDLRVPLSMHMNIVQAKELADTLVEMIEHVKKEKMM
jgi:hypothetical protein